MEDLTPFWPVALDMKMGRRIGHTSGRPVCVSYLQFPISKGHPITHWMPTWLRGVGQSGPIDHRPWRSITPILDWRFGGSDLFYVLIHVVRGRSAWRGLWNLVKLRLSVFNAYSTTTKYVCMLYTSYDASGDDLHAIMIASAAVGLPPRMWVNYPREAISRWGQVYRVYELVILMFWTISSLISCDNFAEVNDSFAVKIVTHGVRKALVRNWDYALMYKMVPREQWRHVVIDPYTPWLLHSHWGSTKPKTLCELDAWSFN